MREHWLLKAVVGGVVTAVVIAILIGLGTMVLEHRRMIVELQGELDNVNIRLDAIYRMADERALRLGKLEGRNEDFAVLQNLVGRIDKGLERLTDRVDQAVGRLTSIEAKLVGRWEEQDRRTGDFP